MCLKLQTLRDKVKNHKFETFTHTHKIKWDTLLLVTERHSAAVCRAVVTLLHSTWLKYMWLCDWFYI